ncbi:MAG: sodium:proton antiporter [Acidimicrobiales bacterium]
MTLRGAQVFVLALPGTLLASLVLTGALTLFPGIDARYAFLLAVILAPTDPVSVLAVFKTSGVASGLRVLLEAESLFNDALGIVLFLLAEEIAFPLGSGHATVIGVSGDFVREIGLGAAAGAVVGLVAHRLMSTLDDHHVEIMLSLITAYGAYLAATQINGSGVMATVVAGLLIGNYGTHRSMAPTSRVTMLEFWEVIAFLTNSALFLLIGLEFRFDDLFESRTLAATGVSIAAMLVGRLVIAFGLMHPFVDRQRPRRRALGLGPPIPRRWRPILFWGGLRGSIPIALALGLAEPNIGGINAPAMVFAVVVFSLIVQGISVRPLLGKLGLAPLVP